MKDHPIYQQAARDARLPDGRKPTPRPSTAEIRRLLNFAADSARDAEDAGIALLRHERDLAELNGVGKAEAQEKYPQLKAGR